MYKSKLMDLIKSMSKAEISDFSDFINSPYFNKKKELVVLFEYIKSTMPYYDHAKLKKETVYKTMFPDSTEFNEKQFGYLMSYLSNKIEVFYQNQMFKKDVVYPDYYLLKTYLDKSLFKHYEGTLKKVKLSFDKMQNRDNSYYLKKYLIHYLGDAYYLKRRLRIYDENIQLSNDYLDYYFLLNKLKNSCSMMDREKFIAAKHDYPFLKESVNYIKSNNKNINDQPGIIMYTEILDMLTAEAPEKHFENLKALIGNYVSVFKREENHNIYLYAINFCARKIREGESKYIEEALNIYVDGIEREVFFQDGFLSPWTFTNASRLSILLKKYDWNEQFISKYHSMLPASFQQNVLNYNLAELYYHTKEFDKSIHHLNKVEFSDFTYSLGSRVILAKVYYETNEEEALLSLIASFSIFLKRNKKITNPVKLPFLNFCDLLNRIMRKKKLDKLKAKIELTESLADKKWLLQICEEAMANQK